jgi:hypothetical protein
VSLTGCPACDLHDRPYVCRGGTAIDQLYDFHRAVHDLLREALLRPAGRLLDVLGRVAGRLAGR